MILESDAKFEEKLTCGLWNNMRNLANFHQSTSKSQNWDFNGVFFVQSWKYMSLKLTRELFVMTIKNDTKTEEELTCEFKINMRNLTNFDPSTQKSQKFALPLTKVYNVWAKNVQGSYVWWHWILIQNLKENWLLLSIMSRGIWEIWTRVLESQNLDFDGILLSKVDNVLA